MFLPSGQTQESWKGMAVASGPIHRHGFAMRELGLEQSGAFLEVDWYSAIAGKIGVNWNQIIPTDQIHTYRSWIVRRIEKLRTEIAGRSEKSIFWLMNRNIVGSDITGRRNTLNWLVIDNVDHGTRNKWGALGFPWFRAIVLYSQNFHPRISPGNSRKSRNIQTMFEDKYYDGLTWYSSAIPPDRIVSLEHSYPHLKKLESRFLLLCAILEWHRCGPAPPNLFRTLMQQGLQAGFLQNGAPYVESSLPTILAIRSQSTYGTASTQ